MTNTKENGRYVDTIV